MAILYLQAVQNTFVSKLYPEKNYSSFRTLFTGKSSNPKSLCRSLFQFDTKLIPSCANIYSATLRLFIYRNDFASILKPTSVHYLSASFDEKTATYSNQPPFEKEAESIVNITDEKNTVISWNITSLVNKWRKDIIPNYGLILTGLDCRCSLTGFFSSRFVGEKLQPVIKVEYSTNDNIIQYPAEEVVTGDEWNYTKSISLGSRTGTYGITNIGISNSAYVKLQLSPDDMSWQDDHPTYMSINEFSPSDNAVLTTNGFMRYARAAYKSIELGHPAELVIYASASPQCN